MTRVCMLSQAQPSTNPRLVKEADALTEAGYEVEVLCTQHVDWAREADRDLLGSRKWKCTVIGSGPETAGWPRLRHKIARSLEPALPIAPVIQAAVGRLVPELAKAAMQRQADLYIARHPGALSAAGRAARKHKARLGYDAEDYETGHASMDSADLSVAASQPDRIARAIERKWLPQCAYVTAGSPAIADAYAEQYGIARPAPVLNVFPLCTRPRQFRPQRTGPLRLYWFSQTIGGDRGLQDVVRAMGSLPECNIELHLRGQWAQGFEDELRQLAASLAVPQQRIVHYAPAPADQMVQLASEFDVGLALEQPVSRNRMLCLTNKMFTYMLAGNAILATSTPGQQPILQTIGPAAVQYNPGDVATFAAELKRWHDDRGALQRSRLASWQWGTDRYNWDTEKKLFLSTVEQVFAAASAEPKHAEAVRAR